MSNKINKLVEQVKAGHLPPLDIPRSAEGLRDSIVDAREFQIGDRVRITRSWSKEIDRGVIVDKWFSRAHNQFVYDFKTRFNGRGYALAHSLELDNDKTSL